MWFFFSLIGVFSKVISFDICFVERGFVGILSWVLLFLCCLYLFRIFFVLMYVLWFDCMLIIGIMFVFCVCNNGNRVVELFVKFDVYCVSW